MPDVAGGGVHLLLGTLGWIWGGKLYILGVAGFVTPIWDVLAPEGEQEGAQKHSTTCSRSLGSQLGNWCQLGLLGLGFATGLVVVGFSRIKICIIAEKMYLHVIYHFLHVWGCNNGWMALDRFR
jgi:hypothetical protein